MTYKVYLAGPDVFLQDFGIHLFTAKKALCHVYGFEGVSPMDGDLNLANLSPFSQGIAIYQGNKTHMRNCHAVIANMTPFRSVSMDVGTAFEMGCMTMLGKPVLGYSNVLDTLAERTERYYALGRHHGVDSYSAGTAIERFDMPDNLMMVGGVNDFGFPVIQRQAPVGEELTHLEGFEECLKLLRTHVDHNR